MKTIKFTLKHDHRCWCGTASPNATTPHQTGADGCQRTMDCAIPVPAHNEIEQDRWLVDGHEITGYSLRHQRGYYQHPCGCWSRSIEHLGNSIDA